ncbi:ATP-dependent DNA helicase DinG [Alkalibacillus silvisoli]|uniref:3'-5' exonuclease DinG n=1 Tax=Alkalibacillus silvisoli TaxID=392823 RepID=A0ABP3JN51_9BACI
MDRYVVVDLETTGHSVKKGDEIIEIGVVVVEDSKIVEEYATKVKPTTDIPMFVSNLTGINEEDLVDAPYFNDIIPDLLPIIENSYFVAHHVHFDYEFLNAALESEGYKPLNCPTIDTVELARILFPKAPGYKLSEITQYLGIDHSSPHRALSDAYVTALLWVKLKQKLQALPLKTLETLDPFISILHSQLDDWFQPLLESKRHLYDASSNLTEQNGLMIQQISEDKQLIDHDSFSFNEVIENTLRLGDDDVREGQLEMAHLIYEKMNQQKNVVIEAGAGLGKTKAYLLPAWYQAYENGKKSVISTSTIQLQNQIVKEAEKLSSAINQQIKITVLKSPKHYINTKRFKMYLDHFDEYENYDAVLTLAIIVIWLTETKTGDIDELNLPSNGENIWKYVNCDQLQSSDDSSYFHKALNQCESSDLIVVNHAFLMTDSLNGYNRIPSFHYAIIDEAHHLENITRDQFSKALSYVSIVHLLQDLQKVVQNDAVDQAKFYADAFFRSVYQAVEFLHSDDDLLTDTGRAQLTVGEDYLNLMLNGEIKDHLNQLLLAINHILNELKGRKNLNQWTKLVIQYAIDKLNEMMNIFKGFFDLSTQDVRWIEIDQYGAKNAATIHVEPIIVSEQLEKVYENADCFVFTSATIQTNQSYQSFLEGTGLNEETECVTLASPFNFDKQTKILIPNNIPDVSKTKVNAYTAYVAGFLEDYVTNAGRKVLVLFTSYDMLRLVYKYLKRLKSLNQYSVIGQGVSTGSRDKLKKMFETEESIILLGTNSFWEGIDLTDQTFKTVCMVRLPFETPSNPFMQAKSYALEKENYNVFEQLALPIAIQRFRQAFGRIIRSKDDRGVFIILDQRIMKKGYGKKFIQSLPKTPVIYDDQKEIIEHAKKWLS